MTIGNFNVLLHIAKELAANMSIEFAGAVLRPHAEYMVPEDKKTKKYWKIVNLPASS